MGSTKRGGAGRRLVLLSVIDAVLATLSAANLTLIYLLFVVGQPGSNVAGFVPIMAIGAVPFLVTAGLLAWVIVSAGSSVKPDQPPSNQWPRFQIKPCSRFCPDHPSQFSLSIRRPDQVVFQQLEPALLRRCDTLLGRCGRRARWVGGGALWRSFSSGLPPAQQGYSLDEPRLSQPPS